MVQTKGDIRALLDAMGGHPRKRFGQHFLIDGNLMRKLIASGELTRQDVVLEVGPGTGSLTEELLEVAGHVVAAEIDRDLAALCNGRLGGNERFTLVQGDALASKSAVAPGLLDVLHARRSELGGRLIMVANLPYQIATPLVIDLLVGTPAMVRMCFTVQAEVGDRLAAAPGGRDFGPISVIAQALARIERVAMVPAGAFWPAPKVASVMLRLDRIDPPAVAGDRLERLTQLVHACFTHRRKTMRYNLQRYLSTEMFTRVAEDGRWDLGARPEAVAVDDWIALAAFAGAGESPRR